MILFWREANILKGVSHSAEVNPGSEAVKTPLQNVLLRKVIYSLEVDRENSNLLSAKFCSFFDFLDGSHSPGRFFV